MVVLNLNYGYKWFSNENIWVKGFLFNNGILYKNEKLLTYFKNISSKKDFVEKIKNANGCFSVILKIKEYYFIAVDKLRTFPLFYMKFNNEIFISDNAEVLKQIKNCNLNDMSVSEYLACGYVTGKETLIDNVYQLQAGEYIIISADTSENEFFFNYLSDVIYHNNYEFLKKKLLFILKNVFQRVEKYTKNHQIVIPLSGGYDSRLIVSMLKLYGVQNVLCYTYGNKNSYEVQISKKVAEKLNYKWIFIEYNENLINDNYTKEEWFIEFAKFSGNYSSKIHMQDFFSIKYLFENSLIDDNSIFMPGHSGDFLGGSHLTDKTNDLKKIKINIYKKHYILNKIQNKEMILNKIYKFLLQFHTKNKYMLEENWNMKERQSKFIINSLRNYEYFGAKHYLPLWDDELTEFFKRVSYEMKKQGFYRQFLFREIFEPLKIDFVQPERQDRIIKKLLRPFIPDVIRKYRKKKYFQKNNKNNTNLIIKSFVKDLNIKYIDYEFNEILVKWYINLIAEGKK